MSHEPDTINVTYLGETHTLHCNDGVWTSDGEKPCVIKALRIDGNTVSLELNIATPPK